MCRMSNLSEELDRVRAERDELRDFFDNAPDMFVSVDAETARIRDCNDTLLGALGYRRDEVVGHPVTRLYHPDCAEEVRRAFDSFRNTGHASSDELFLQRSNGEKLPVSLRASAVRDEFGHVLYSRSIWRDISVHRELAALKLEARVQEAQRLESLAVLAGGIAHDFNNLLGTVLGNAELALRRLPDDAPTRDLLENIERASLRASELTRQMLAYSGKGRFEIEVLELGALVEEMAHLLESAISRRTTLRVERSAANAFIEADATQVRQVVLNLITNGSEAIESEDGTVQIRISTLELFESDLAEWDELGELTAGEFVLLEVVDSGSGMSEEVRARMFDPFFTTKAEGHGLGLAAMQGIVRGHHGAVRVQTSQGEGTTIHVLFPRSHAHPAPPRSTPEATPEGSGRVLIVDDEPHVRELLTLALTEAGYEVIAGSDGVEGVGLFLDHAGDLRAVLLDMSMPRLGGREALAQMAAHDPSVPIILMSGFSKDVAKTPADSAQPAGFLHKPFKLRELLSRLGTLGR